MLTGIHGLQYCVVMSQKQLILASQSPQRRLLLQQAGYSFEVIVPDENAECGICSRETPPELVARLAMQKARNVALKVDQGLVLGCDTVAECHGQILGKPVDSRHAHTMLSLMRGREHRVFSGVCLWARPSNNHTVRVDKTILTMDSLTDAQIDEYLAAGGWRGKAGAFGYQDHLGWVTVCSGSESNVVGLPMELLEEMLAGFSIG